MSFTKKTFLLSMTLLTSIFSLNAATPSNSLPKEFVNGLLNRKNIIPGLVTAVHTSMSILSCIGASRSDVHLSIVIPASLTAATSISTGIALVLEKHLTKQTSFSGSTSKLKKAAQLAGRLVGTGAIGAVATLPSTIFIFLTICASWIS